jgi:hypothetical protein
VDSVWWTHGELKELFCFVLYKYNQLPVIDTIVHRRHPATVIESRRTEHLVD